MARLATVAAFTGGVVLGVSASAHAAEPVPEITAGVQPGARLAGLDLGLNSTKSLSGGFPEVAHEHGPIRGPRGPRREHFLGELGVYVGLDFARSLEPVRGVPFTALGACCG
ncbi:hypothetical protein Aab01nite_50350 [Paractinoplanes abujensis]|nr:hypothetical protein Aab01nite_50350 [Actinoplanes abujensis]